MFIYGKKDNWMPAKTFRNNLAKLIRQARKFSKRIIFVGPAPCDEKKLDPIPWHKTGAYRNNEILKYHNILKEVCKKEKVYFIDFYERLTRSRYEDFLDGDGIHLNSKGHKIIFETVRDFLVGNKII